MTDGLLKGKSAQCIIKNEEQVSTRGTAPPKITVILPAYNEEVSIGSIVILTKLYADNVIVVDDGSSDRTAEIARKAGAEVMVHEVNMGKGRALKTGFEAAHGADIIVTMDSDGQHNPAEIPKLVIPIIEEDADMINGSRYLNGMDRNTPAYRRVGQTVLDGFTNLNSCLTITDSPSGFRAFAASTIDIFRFNARGMAIESEMLADAGRAGLRIKEVDISVRYDVGCSTKKPIQHGLEVLIRILKDMEFNRPLFYFTAPGVSFGIVGLYMGAHSLEAFSMGRGLYFGPTMLMILLIIVGCFMSLIGILLHSIAAILRDAKVI